MNNAYTKSILLLFLALSTIGYGNDSTLVKKVLLKDIDKVTHDAYFNFYIATTKGQIFKYDKLGNYLLVNSPTKPQPINNLEAFNTVRVFAFYSELQEFNFFDRFLTFENSIKLDPFVIGYAKCATTSSDNSIWIFDERDFGLKKYDPVLQKITQNTACNLLFEQGDHNITYMKEYQNQLFMVDKDSGIYIFDNLGNYKKQLKINDVTHISFYENEIYFFCGSKIYKQDLYYKFTLEEYILERPYYYYFVSDDYEYVFDGSGFQVLKKKQ